MRHTMSKRELLAAMKAHNAHKQDAVYNENYNAAYGLGSMQGRALCAHAAEAKHGHAGDKKRITKEDLLHYCISRNIPVRDFHKPVTPNPNYEE